MGTAFAGFNKNVIAPSLKAERENQRAIAHLRARIEMTRDTLRKPQSARTEAAIAFADLQKLQETQPAESSLVWLPSQLKEHFGKFKFPVSSCRMNIRKAVEGLPLCERDYWTINLAVPTEVGGVNALLFAIGEMESRQPFVQVQDVTFRKDTKNPNQVNAKLNLSVLHCGQNNGKTPVPSTKF